jgi:hypothetical protein
MPSRTRFLYAVAVVPRRPSFRCFSTTFERQRVPHGKNSE